MEELATGNLAIDLPVTRKGLVLPLEIIKNLDYVYRSNPYPSKSEYENLCNDMNLPFQRVKNWFCNRRRRDSKSGKICRKCRFFRAPINEQTHMEDVTHRPCISYWSLPTVAPPPMALMSLQSVDSGHSSSSIDKSRGQDVKLGMNENLPTSMGENIVPSAFSLSVKPVTFTSEQSMFTTEIGPRYIHQQQHTIGHYPVDMGATNSWMMPPTGSAFWPMPLHNYCQPPDGQQLSLDYHLPSDWRSSQMHRIMPNYSLPYERYPHNMKIEKKYGNCCKHEETNNNW